MSTDVELFESPAGPLPSLLELERQVDEMFDSPAPELERDQYNRPLIEPPPGGWADPDNPRWVKDQKRYGGRRPYQRASTFAGELDNGVGLSIWKTDLVALHVAKNADIAAVIAGFTYGPKDRPVLRRYIEDALTRGAKEEASLAAANWGTAIHRFVEPNSPPTAPERLQKDISAYKREHRRKNLTILDTEVFIVNDELGVAGTFDDLVQLPTPAPDCPVWSHHSVVWDIVVDRPAWYCEDCAGCPELEGPDPDAAETRIEDKKTGKLHLLGQTIQLATYANGHRYDVATGERTQIHPTLSRQWAVLAHIPLGSGTCDLWEVDIAAGYEIARLAAVARECRRNEKALFHLWS